MTLQYNTKSHEKTKHKTENVEKEIEALQSKVDELKEIINLPEVASDYEKLSQLLEDIKTKEVELEELETIWLELA